MAAASQTCFLASFLRVPLEQSLSYDPVDNFRVGFHVVREHHNHFTLVPDIHQPSSIEGPVQGTFVPRRSELIESFTNLLNDLECRLYLVM